MSIQVLNLSIEETDGSLSFEWDNSSYEIEIKLGRERALLTLKINGEPASGFSLPQRTGHFNSDARTRSIKGRWRPFIPFVDFISATFFRRTRAPMHRIAPEILEFIQVMELNFIHSLDPRAASVAMVAGGEPWLVYSFLRLHDEEEIHQLAQSCPALLLVFANARTTSWYPALIPLIERVKARKKLGSILEDLFGVLRRKEGHLWRQYLRSDFPEERSVIDFKAWMRHAPISIEPKALFDPAPRFISDYSFPMEQRDRAKAFSVIRSAHVISLHTLAMDHQRFRDLLGFLLQNLKLIGGGSDAGRLVRFVAATQRRVTSESSPRRLASEVDAWELGVATDAARNFKSRKLIHERRDDVEICSLNSVAEYAELGKSLSNCMTGQSVWSRTLRAPVVHIRCRFGETVYAGELHLKDSRWRLTELSGARNIRPDEQHRARVQQIVDEAVNAR